MGNTTSPRTGVDAITILRCKQCTVRYKRSVELLNAFGVTNDLSGAGVENCIGLSNHFDGVSSQRKCDLIKVCLPVALWRSTH